MYICIYICIYVYIFVYTHIYVCVCVCILETGRYLVCLVKKQNFPTSFACVAFSRKYFDQ